MREPTGIDVRDRHGRPLQVEIERSDGWTRAVVLRGTDLIHATEPVREQRPSAAMQSALAWIGAQLARPKGRA